jgi:hypothetical protein
MAFGVIAAISGLGFLRVAWGRRAGPRGVVIVAAWLLIALSLLSWGAAAQERGVAIGVLIFVALAMACMVALFARQRPAASSQSDRSGSLRDESKLTAGVLGRRVWIFVLAGPLSLIATCLLGGLCYALLTRAGAATTDAIMVATLLAPVVWGGLMCWVLMDVSLVRRTAGVLGAAALGAACFVLT